MKCHPWISPHVSWLFVQKLVVDDMRFYRNERLFLNSTLRVSAVSHEDGGTYTCKCVSEAGVTTATTQLRVIGKPSSVKMFFFCFVFLNIVLNIVIHEKRADE